MNYDYDALIIEFEGNYLGKYKHTGRIFKDLRAVITINVNGYGSLIFPVTNEDEHFERRLMTTPECADLIQDKRLAGEFKGIHEWIINAYRSLELIYCNTIII